MYIIHQTAFSGAIQMIFLSVYQTLQYGVDAVHLALLYGRVDVHVCLTGIQDDLIAEKRLKTRVGGFESCVDYTVKGIGMSLGLASDIDAV